MQASYSGSNRSVKYLFENATEVSVEQILTSGTPVATITVDGDDVDLYAPAGGGSDVVANPVGTPTDDLDTIEIDGVIYDIPGSGGGSTNYGKFTCDLLFVNDPLPPVQDCRAGLTKNYTLTKSIDDYDAVYFVALTSYQTQGATNDDCVKTIVLKQDFYNPSNTVMVSSFTDGRYLQIVFTSDTAIQTIAYASQSFYCPTLYKVYGLKFENKLINRSDIYSEEERMIGRWTDGKPLYQKTFLQNWTSDGEYHIDVASLHIDKFIKSEGYANRYDVMEFSEEVNVNFINNINSYKFTLWYNRESEYLRVLLYMPEHRSSRQSITIQYTKTTDQPNSGFLPEDPQMVMMSDYYSEDEQVVGRWTDGKPLYQKTYLLGSGVYITNSGISISSYLDNLSAYDQIIDAVGYGKNNNDARVDSLYLNTGGMAYCAEGMTTNRITVKYTKTTDVPGTGPTKGNLIYLPALYSEEEREVGVWTDGKPLYQKTYRNLGLSIPQTYWTSTGITIPNMEHWEVIFDKALNSEYDNQYAMLYRMYNGDFQAFCTYAISLDELTIQYTKTTDQPGSGKYLPDGQLAHHYSTSEKIVGTWIDGSTVYERTWDLGSATTFPNNTWTPIVNNVDIPINKIIKCEGVQADPCAVSFDIWFDSSSNSLKARSLRDGIESIRYFTIQYTKSS